MHIMLPVTIAAWYFDMVAIYYMRFPMFPTAFALNVSMGVLIIVAHTLQDQKVTLYFFNFLQLINKWANYLLIYHFVLSKRFNNGFKCILASLQALRMVLPNPRLFCQEASTSRVSNGRQVNIFLSAIDGNFWSVYILCCISCVFVSFFQTEISQVVLLSHSYLLL